MYFNLTLRPERRLSQRDQYFNLDIATAARSAGAGASKKGAERAVAKEGLEDILEATERVAARGCSCARHLVAVGVVGPARLGVGEDLVSFGELLEAVLGPRVAGVCIGVVFAGELAVSLLYLRFRGSVGEAQDLVVVALVARQNLKP